jgi:DNA gyrase subunit A
VVTRDGWVKRQISFTALDKIRVRDGDQLGWLARAHTRAIVTIFGDQGTAYATRVDDLPATTGHGEPVQRQFALADGERIIGLASHDARVRPPLEPPPGPEDPPGPYAIALTRRGRVLRFPLDAHDEPSTKNGRRVIRLDEGARGFAVWPAPAGGRLTVASRLGRAVAVGMSDVPVLKSTKRGVVAIELKPDDEVFAADLTLDVNTGVVVHANNGETYTVSAASLPKGTFGSPGRMLFRKSAELDGWLDRRPSVVGAVDAEADRAHGGVT